MALFDFLKPKQDIDTEAISNFSTPDDYGSLSDYYQGINRTPSTMDLSVSGRNTNAPNIAQTQMVGSAIGAGADVAGGIIQSVFQNAESEKNRKEARELANINREDTLKQENEEYKLQKQAQDQEERKFAIEKTQQQFTLRYNRFMTRIKNAIDAQQKITGAAQKLFNTMQTTDLQNIIAQTGSKQ